MASKILIGVWPLGRQMRSFGFVRTRSRHNAAMHSTHAASKSNRKTFMPADAIIVSVLRQAFASQVHSCKRPQDAFPGFRASDQPCPRQVPVGRWFAVGVGEPDGVERAPETVVVLGVEARDGGVTSRKINQRKQPRRVHQFIRIRHDGADDGIFFERAELRGLRLVRGACRAVRPANRFDFIQLRRVLRTGQRRRRAGPELRCNPPEQQRRQYGYDRNDGQRFGRVRVTGDRKQAPPGNQ